MTDIFSRIRGLDTMYRVIIFAIFLVALWLVEWAVLSLVGFIIPNWIKWAFNVFVILYLAFQILRGRS